MNVRIAIVAESFPPDVNGVAHCTLRVAEHLVARGHYPLVIAPAPPRGVPGAAGPFPCPVARLRSVPVPRYRNFRVAVPGPPLRSAVAAHRAELIHLASGWDYRAPGRPGHPPGAPGAPAGHMADIRPHQAELHDTSVAFLAAAV